MLYVPTQGAGKPAQIAALGALWYDTDNGQIYQQLDGPKGSNWIPWNGLGRFKRSYTLAQINALGAVTTGQLAFRDLPANGRIIRAQILNNGDPAGGVAALTASLGSAGGAYVDVLAPASVFAANAFNEGAIVTPLQSVVADTTLKVQLISAGGNMDAVTGLASGITVLVQYLGTDIVAAPPPPEP